MYETALKEETKFSENIILFFLIVGILTSLVRLVDLQIIQGGYFRALSEGNRVRRIVLRAPRGEIVTSDGFVLAKNKQVLMKAIFSPGGTVESFVEISKDSQEEETGVVDYIRFYESGATAAHITGYVGQVNEDEVGKSNPLCPERGVFKIGDFTGRSGVEAYYDCLLRGVDGEQLVEVDTQGKFVRILGQKNPIPGANLSLSINQQIQEAAYAAMLGKKGALIAQDPTTGGILALVAAPSYDPNFFVKGEPGASAVLNDPEQPLFNRAISGVYPPGSTFKVATSVAVLEEGKVDRNYIYNDEGVIRVNEFSYSNWFFNKYGKLEGSINIVRALARSTDTFFYRVSELVGPDRIAKWAGILGLGRKTGIDLFGESEGLIPTPLWKERVKAERWFLGNTYHVAIGQGDILTTPLQVNLVTSLVAASGRLCKPKLVANQTDCQETGLKKETLQLIKEGMEGACSSGGTAFPFFSFKPQIACKTGTAEFGDAADATHAWLTTYAPLDKPEIAVTALVEAGGEGSAVAAPIVKEVLTRWFRKGS